MARPPRPAATFTLGLQKRARPRKSVAKGGGRPGARASATTTPGQPRAALPQRATSRRALTTGRGAAARAAERSTLGAASGRHGWRTASRREGAGAGTAIAQHHAGTGGRAGGPGAGTHAQRQVGASEAGQGTPAQRRLASGSGRGKLQRQPTPRTSSGQQYAGRPTPPGPGHPGRGPLSCHRLLPTTRPSVFPSATGPQGAALCHKRNIRLEFVHQSGVRQSGRPRDWPDTRRGFLSGVKVPATQCDRIELPMAAVTRPLLPGCTPTGAPMAKGLRMQTSRVA